MDEFDTILEKATARGSNNVPGAILAVVDKEGNYIYKKAAGVNGVKPDAAPLDFDQTFAIFSLSKLVTSVAALQTVERGLIGLDDCLDDYLPELTKLPIITRDGESFKLRKAEKSITLRHLLTHSSGTVYELFDPAIKLWYASRGISPPPPPNDQIVAVDYAHPRSFEAGESWQYGTGLDWAGLLVARLNKVSLEEYIQENISKPLHITSFTYHLARNPHVAEKLMRMSARQEDGTFADAQTPLLPEPVEEGGGSGMYGNMHDYTRFLSDLLKDEPTLLKKESVERLFTPQFPEGSGPLRDMYVNSVGSWEFMVGGSVDGVTANHGLGGAILQDDVKRKDYFKPNGTLTWSGMPNLLWSVNRKKGLALVFATQVLAWGDLKTQALSHAFETAVWRHLSG